MYVVNVDIFSLRNNWLAEFFFNHQKPVVCLLLLPPTQPRQAVTPTLPMIQLPSNYKPRPDPYAVIKRYTGRALDRVIGAVWCLFTLVGAGSSIIGLFNFFLGLGAWVWWKNNRARGDVHVWRVSLFIGMTFRTVFYRSIISELNSLL